MASCEQYWARIRRIPLIIGRESDDGNSVLCHAADGSGVVTVTKPEFFRTDADREAAVRGYELMYGRNLN